MYLGPNSNQAKSEVKKTVASGEIKPTISLNLLCWNIMGKTLRIFTLSRNPNCVTLWKTLLRAS